MERMNTTPVGVAADACAEDAGAETKRGTRGKGIRWTKAKKERFLDHLAATCHVAAAADAIGEGITAMYTLRRRDATFAKGWSAALRLGYEMLETQVVGHALAGGGRRTIGDGEDVRNAGLDVELALKLLTTHRNAMAGKPFNTSRKPLVATREEANAQILRKLRMVEARNAPAALPAPASEIAIGQDG